MKRDKKSEQQQQDAPLEEPSAIIEMDLSDAYKIPQPDPDDGDETDDRQSPLETPKNHYELQSMEFARNSPVRLTKIYLGEVNDAGDIDQLESANEFFIMPKIKRSGSGGGGRDSSSSKKDETIKIANRDGNHIFSCSIKRMKTLLGCRRRSDSTKSSGKSASQRNKEERRDKKKIDYDYSYRLMDLQGLKLVTGKLAGKKMEIRTGLKNSLGSASKASWSSKYTISPSVGNELWYCKPTGGCCLFSCGVKSFQIINSVTGQQMGLMRKDSNTNKFVISVRPELTVANKGLIVVTGLMIYDQYFSSTSCDCGGRCGGVSNARCCCCTIFTIIILILLILLVVFLVLYLTSDDNDEAGSTEAFTGETTTVDTVVYDTEDGGVVLS